MSKPVIVTAPPVASFRGNPTSGTAPLAVKLTDSPSGIVDSWSWSFGNGATSASKSPSYAYSSPGAYSVSLTVSGPGGSNKSTRAGCITVTSTSSGGGTGVSAAGLVAAYGFDETSGTQVLDASGQSNYGTLANATRTTQAKFRRALSFNGSYRLVTVNDSAWLDLTSVTTISAWVYLTSWASGWKTMRQKERSGGLAYALSADVGQPNSPVRIGGSDRQLTAGSHLPSNTWTHLAATYDGATQRLYVNGTQVGSRSRTGSLEVSANPLRIGGNTVWAGQFFQGLIDEVLVYNRALTQSEIVAVAEEPLEQCPMGPGSRPDGEPRAPSPSPPRPSASPSPRLRWCSPRSPASTRRTPL